MIAKLIAAQSLCDHNDDPFSENDRDHTNLAPTYHGIRVQRINLLGSFVADKASCTTSYLNQCNKFIISQNSTVYVLHIKSVRMYASCYCRKFDIICVRNVIEVIDRNSKQSDDHAQMNSLSFVYYFDSVFREKFLLQLTAGLKFTALRVFLFEISNRCPLHI